LNYRRLVTLFLCVASISAQAEQRWFEVELLVFQRNVDIESIAEHLPSQEIMVNTEKSISILDPIKRSDCVEGVACLSKKNPTVITSAVFDQEGNSFKRLDRSKLQLVEQRQKLEDHAGFNPVFHMAWRMPVAKGTRATPIHLFAGENLAYNQQKRQLKNKALNVEPKKTNSALEIDPLSENTEQLISTEISGQLITPENEKLIDINPDKWAIDGNFKIYLDHYLYIDSQLIIRQEATEDVVQEEQAVEVFDDENGVQIATQIENNVAPKVKQQTVIKEILFDQNRRLRSEEIHYLDHPLIGIIVQIRKIPEQ